MGKFNKKLVADIKKEKEQEKQQRRLRVKYEVPEDVMIIEKDNTIKFFIRTTGNIVKLITGIIIFLLTVIGVSALIFPVSRMELFNQLMNTWNELKDFVFMKWKKAGTLHRPCFSKNVMYEKVIW